VRVAGNDRNPTDSFAGKARAQSERRPPSWALNGI